VKQLLITVLLALGPAAAPATPTLELAGDELRGWKGIEITVYQSDPQPASHADPRDARDAYPFNP
jgi:hypothetical protein